MKLLLSIALSLAFLTGCGTVGTKLDQLQLGMDVVVLESDFEAAVETLMFNDWNAIEEQEITRNVVELQKLRNGVKAMAKGESEGLDFILTVGTSREVLDRIAFHYNAVRTMYISYLKRENLTPDPSLAAYDRAGGNAWRSMSAYVDADNGGGIKVTDLVDLISYVARGYLLFKSDSVAGSI